MSYRYVTNEVVDPSGQAPRSPGGVKPAAPLGQDPAFLSSADQGSRTRQVLALQRTLGNRVAAQMLTESLLVQRQGGWGRLFRVAGPHRYVVRTRMPSGFTRAQVVRAWNANRQHQAPYAPAGELKEGEVELANIAPIQMSNPSPDQWVNSTKPGHPLHPGKVVRSLKQEGDNLIMVTEGTGKGIAPGLNERLAPRVWGSVDKKLIDAIKEEKPK